MIEFIRGMNQGFQDKSFCSGLALWALQLMAQKGNSYGLLKGKNDQPSSSCYVYLVKLE